MKKSFFLPLLFFVTVFSTTSVAAKSKNNIPADVNKINKLLQNYGDLNVGIIAADLSNGHVIYQHNANRYFMPASNEKLFTGYAALQYLGPNFTYQTQVFADTNKIQNGTLNDNVYMRFSGDPTLTLTQLEHLIQSLTKAGIQHINGKIIIDDSIFDQINKSPGSSWDDSDYCWGSPISALRVDNNCVSAIIKPSSKANTRSHLVLPTHPQSMNFINEVMTQPGNKKACALDINLTSENTYTITGCIKTTNKPVGFSMAIQDPRANMRLLINYFLKKNHVTTKSDIDFKNFNSAPKLLAEERSEPLQKLVTSMMKDSDNSIADTLFKTMGAMYSHKPGSFDNGHDAVRSIIFSNLHLNIPKTTLVDGSGASRYNFLTPQLILLFLQKAYSSSVAKEFIASLPISGIDGTLKYRLKSPGILGKIRAKTGTETAVTALSGYAETRSKKMIVFSILINNFIEMPRKYKALENKICKWLVENN